MIPHFHLRSWYMTYAIVVKCRRLLCILFPFLVAGGLKFFKKITYIHEHLHDLLAVPIYDLSHTKANVRGNVGESNCADNRSVVLRGKRIGRKLNVCETIIFHICSRCRNHSRRKAKRVSLIDIMPIPTADEYRCRIKHMSVSP